MMIKSPKGLRASSRVSTACEMKDDQRFHGSTFEEKKVSRRKTVVGISQSMNE